MSKKIIIHYTTNGSQHIIETEAEISLEEFYKIVKKAGHPNAAIDRIETKED